MRVTLVTKKSTYEQVIGGPGALADLPSTTIRRIKEAHEDHIEATSGVIRQLEKLGIHPTIVDGAGEAFDAARTDLVITVGGDGTLLGASHYVGSKTPILAINSDPLRSKGHFCATTDTPTEEMLRAPKIEKVTRMEVMVRGKSVGKRVLNEALYCHSCPAATSKFGFEGVRKQALQVCSGVWVSTGAGSTGALKSAGGEQCPKTSPYLQAVIREPFNGESPAPQHAIKFTAESRMPTSVLYLDGPFLQIPVGFGDKVTFRPSREYLQLVVP